MATEVASELTNVVRFPMERHAPLSMALVQALEPDVRDVAFAVALLGLAPLTHGLEEGAAAETAWRVAGHVRPLAADERSCSLDGMLGPVMARAVAACREAGRAAAAASEAERAVLAALAEGGRWMAPLERRSDALLREAAERLVVAHVRCSEAHSVEREVEMVRGKTWPAPANKRQRCATRQV